MRVFVVTSNAYSWALKPFAYLFNCYWSSLQSVIAIGFEYPSFPLPPNFKFHKVNARDEDQSSWSNALIEFLVSVPDDHFALFLEDYFLIRTVDHAGVSALCEYARNNRHVLRVDLTSDVMYVAGDGREAPELPCYGHYDMVYKPFGSSYRMSLQAGIWSRNLLLSILQPNKSSWQTEMHIDPPAHMLVCGTKQSPVRYANAIWKGQIDEKEIARIPDEHRERVLAMIPPGWKVEGRG